MDSFLRQPPRPNLPGTLIRSIQDPLVMILPDTDILLRNIFIFDYTWFWIDKCAVTIQAYFLLHKIRWKNLMRRSTWISSTDTFIFIPWNISLTWPHWTLQLNHSVPIHNIIEINFPSPGFELFRPIPRYYNDDKDRYKLFKNILLGFRW